MVDFVQIVLFGVACGVGTDAVSQDLLTFLRALLTLSQTSAADAVHRFASLLSTLLRAVPPCAPPIVDRHAPAEPLQDQVL